MKHVIYPGDKYGRLTVIREVRKAANGRETLPGRAVPVRLRERVTPLITSLKSGDARSCGCSRGKPRYEQKLCPVCGTLALIRRDHKSCSRARGYELTRRARRARARPMTYGTTALRKPAGRPADTLRRLRPARAGLVDSQSRQQ